MAQIPLLSTGIPIGRATMLKVGTINKLDAGTTAKNLFILRKGEVLIGLGIFGNAASNSATSASISVGAKVLNNAGSALGPVLGVFMTYTGTAYTSAPTVAFAGGGGTGAAATAVINSAGGVIGVRMTSLGTGYTSAPTVSFSGGGGSGAAATAVVALTNTFLNAFDVKTAGTASGQQWPTTQAGGQFVPMPADVMVTGTYTEVGAATAGGPWIIQAYVVLPQPQEWAGFMPAA